MKPSPAARLLLWLIRGPEKDSWDIAGATITRIRELDFH